MSWPPCEVLPVAVTRGSKSRVPVNQPLTTMSLPTLATARISSSLIDPMRKGTATAGSPGPGSPPGPVGSGSKGPQAASTISVNSRRFLVIPESIGFLPGRQERRTGWPASRRVSLLGQTPGNKPMSLVSAAVLLFFVMDPLGNVPLFLAALRHVDPARYRIVILRELVFALVIMVVFLFLGRHL